MSALRVLYLFAGAKRRADMRHFLSHMCQTKGISLQMTEVDILRSGKHDLSKRQIKVSYLRRARQGDYDTVIASPPRGTFSRARWANREGPRPLRLAHCPRGFPWLSGPMKDGANQANALVDFSAAMMSAHLKQNPNATGLIEHPEDLGVVSSGHHPGSIWQFSNVKALLDLPGVCWGALAQNNYGTPYPKPTRLLGRLPGLQLCLSMGPPTFSSTGIYDGPLPKQTSTTPMTLGRNDDGRFRTQVTAAWPPAMCEMIAQKVIENFVLCNGKALKTGATGAEEVRTAAGKAEGRTSKEECKAAERSAAMPLAPPDGRRQTERARERDPSTVGNSPAAEGGMTELMGGLTPRG